MHYGTEEQKKRWLPKLATGEMIGAIAMSEPGTGSDLQGVRTTAVKKGNRYVLNGSKTFITNGQHANLVIVVAKTDPKERAKGISLLVVETDDAPGFRRGRKHSVEMIGSRVQLTLSKSPKHEPRNSRKKRKKPKKGGTSYPSCLLLSSLFVFFG